MPNNPVQVVLNTEKFLGRPDRPPGGKVKDFFADRDVQFANHKRRVLNQIADINEQIHNELGIGYAHVTLQSDAFAKSHRPFQALLPPDRVPLIGGGKFGELIVEFTAENLPTVENAIRRAEDVVVFRLNKEGEEEPRPSRARSEVGAISSIRAHEPIDRRAFSAEEAVAWLDDLRTGGLYIIETFVDPAEVSAAETDRVRAKVALSSFLEKLQGLGVRVETIEAPPRFRGHRLLFLKLARRKSESRKERVARHQTFLEFVEKQAAVRRVLLPPLIEPGHEVHGTPGDAVVFSPPRAGDFPVVGVIDTGAAKIPSLEAWCAGRTDFVGGGSGQDRSHGTFIAGLTVASGQLNSHSVLAEPPCKFFDLALFPTSASQFASFFPNGFLDFLQQLEEELGEAKAAGARVFNMSLSLERQVTDDRYGFFASYVDQIVDKQDILLVLPSGNLDAAQRRNEWPDSPPKVLKMLAEYRHSDKDRVLEPAESVRAVVAGALNPPSCVDAPLRPATYTRRGPSTALGTKPDVAHVGGNAITSCFRSTQRDVVSTVAERVTRRPWWRRLWRTSIR
ncbi:MAG: S8 family serine peptidase [Gammaproteobacteria bacterium]